MLNIMARTKTTRSRKPKGAEEVVMTKKEQPISEDKSTETTEELDKEAKTEVVEETLVNKSEDLSKDDVAQVVEEKVMKTPHAAVITSVGEKTVSCRVNINHNCVIGKQKYALTKGEVVSLPSSVAAILANTGIVIKR